MYLHSGVSSFSELKRVIMELPDQTTGMASSVSDIGEEYVEFFERGLARPGDEEVVEGVVAEMMWSRLSNYFKGKNGRIYWRIPLETSIEPTTVIVRFDENGPDMDPLTARRCVMDKRWVRLAVYCRLIKATRQLPDLRTEMKVVA